MTAEKKRQVRLSYDTFAMALEELVSGPCTAQQLTEVTGMGHRYVRRMLKAFKARKLVHISGYDKDAIGRISVTVFAFGPGKDAPRKGKPRAAVNREYRARASMAPLKGTPFYGLTVASESRRSA
jgi:hypothetical protein